MSQDVWSELGAPTGTAAKEIDTMRIHAGSGRAASAAAAADYFYNYASRLRPCHCSCLAGQLEEWCMQGEVALF